MKLKQIIALLFVATLSLSIFCSCGKKDKNKSNASTTTTEQETKKTETTEENVPVVATTSPTEETKKNKNVKKYSSKKASSKKTSSSSTKTPTKHKHKYVNGICSCGKANKSKPHLALTTLLKKYGKLDEDKCYSKEYLVGNTYYVFYFDPSDKSYNICCSEILNGKPLRGVGLSFCDKSDSLIVGYFDDNQRESGCILSRSSFSSNTNISLNKFSGTEKQKSEATAYTKKSSKLIMSKFNSFLSSTKSGLTLKDLGFVNY